MIMPTVGQRVRSKIAIDRFPDFLLDEIGLLGTVIESTEHVIVVKLDEHHDCLDEWENCLNWSADVAEEFWYEFETDFE